MSIPVNRCAYKFKDLECNVRYILNKNAGMRETNYIVENEEDIDFITRNLKDILFEMDKIEEDMCFLIEQFDKDSRKGETFSRWSFGHIWKFYLDDIRVLGDCVNNLSGLWMDFDTMFRRIDYNNGRNCCLMDSDLIKIKKHLLTKVISKLENLQTMSKKIENMEKAN